MAKVDAITIPVDFEPSERLRTLIAEEVARQLKDIRNLPLDELAKAIDERLARQLRIQTGARAL